MVGRLAAVVLDAADIGTLARFYSELLGLPILSEEDDWIDIGEPGGGTRVSFQYAPDHVPPQWPDPAHPQQLHLDVRVDDIEEAERRTLALGAKHVHSDTAFRVYTDPAGHPFCLVHGE
ncbi:VOC family protein [Streptomonospora nanhaiensis]|uniref:Catechol-2,3-dioxygenase n=1 Tax=Streptomonospora nanhaiensis TaxID=1323731 RepID=A0A853BR31_9ACTN|nr:VOC family protein [Streptomonospora nanhaiensis]MBV2364019.1 VOC family protein [Streptomonospora nanhaiensis]MBX9387363.1 VOC family protein [Streptomonospora nanhaiensis]NYI97017.1 catechol-2,3-dioxygenase [Streptomonospora nanhaiensis]